MGKLNISSVLQSLLGLDVTALDNQARKDLIRRSIAEGRRAEAFILASSTYGRGTVPEFLAIGEMIAGCSIRDLGNENALYVANYQDAISRIFMSPLSTLGAMIVLISPMNEGAMTDDQKEFLRALSKLHFTSGLFDNSIVSSVAFQYCNSFKEDPNHHLTLQCLIKTLIKYKNLKLVSAFYWYFLYIGYTSIAQTIFLTFKKEERVEALAMPFTGDVIWFQEGKAKRDGRYLKLKTAYESAQVSIGYNSIATLIPMCLYALEKEDIVIESFALCWALVRSDSQALFQRMEEISGRSAPLRFKQITEEVHRKNWIAFRLNLCGEVAKGKQVSKGAIKAAKEMYPLSPFDGRVIRCLVTASVMHCDDEIVEMLRLNISRTVSANTLGSLLAYAITEKSTVVVQIVLRKIYVLGFASTILKSIEKALARVAIVDGGMYKVVVEALAFYKLTVSKENHNENRYLGIITKLNSGSLIFQALHKITDQDLLDEERTAIAYASNNDYKGLYQYVQSDHLESATILEVVLKVAIKFGHADRVVETYKSLCILDAAVAAFYSIRVAPFFKGQRNIPKEYFSSGVSSVWSNPTTLDFPIDKKTFRIVNYGR